MAQMGFNGAPYVAYRHSDTGHSHVHIVGLRITADGATISDANDYRRAEAAARDIERRFGFRAVAPPSKSKRRHSMNEVVAMSNPGAPETAPQKSAEMSCKAGDQPSATRRREMRRATVEPTYEARLRDLFGEELRGVGAWKQGGVAYFKDGGEVRDHGDRFAVKNMGERDAARRLVMLALDRGWTSATFTGSDDFLRAAFRAALDKGLDVHPANPHQAQILSEVKASFSSAARTKSAIEPDSVSLSPLGVGMRGRLDALRRSREQAEEQFRHNRVPR